MTRNGVIVAVVGVFSLYDAARVMAANTAVPCIAQSKAIIATSGNVLIVNAGTTVDSYNSNKGPYGGGNVGSNGDIIAGGSITNNGGTVKGTETVHTSTNLPALPVPPGAANLPPGSSTPGTININTQGDSITLTPGTYVVGYLNVNYPGSINISPAGSVTIYVTGGLNLGGNENHNGIPNNLTFVVTSAATINVNSTGSLYGNIYAPTASVVLSSTVYGYVVGSSVTLNSGCSIHRDESEACAGVGVSPSLNCVMKTDSTTYGAIFGYTNTTGSNVQLGAGPNNLFASGPVDRGQPILFVPGQVPMATFQAFRSNSSLTYTIEQKSVTASANSPACSSDVAAAIMKLYKGTPASQSVESQIAAIVANPNFGIMLATARARIPTLTPYQASMLDAMVLIANSADLLVKDGALTSSQLQRLTTLRASLLSNPAVVQLRLFGDAQRATPGQVSCDVMDTINAGHPAVEWTPPQPGSISSQIGVMLRSSSFSAVQNAVAGVANGLQSSALLTVNGLLLAAFRPAEALDGLQLSGTPIPTCWTCWVEGVGGAIVGGFLGGLVGGAVGGALTGGDPIGIVSGVVVGASLGGYYGFKEGYSGFQLTAGAGGSCVDWCGDSGCNQKDCAPGSELFLMSSFNQGVPPQCSGACQLNSDCGSGRICVESCCYDTSNFAKNCPAGSTCKQNSDCRPGNNCIFGCCIGDCGYNGISCTTLSEPLTCGNGAGNQTCDSGSECAAGCCQVIER